MQGEYSHTAVQIQSGFAEVNGCQLFYETAGSGPAVFLVHAGIADRRMWDSQFHALARHYRAVRYDQRGYGQSPVVPGEFSSHVDLLHLMNFLGIDRACLVGCSMGGGAIIDFALAYPQRTRALVIVASAPHGFQFDGEPPSQWDEMAAAFKQGDLDRAAELELQIWVDGPQRTPDQVNPAVRSLALEMDKMRLANVMAGRANPTRLQPLAADRLAEINVPTLVVIGELDNPSLVKSCEILAAQISGARLARQANAAHLPSMEQPKAFNRLLLEFLKVVYKK